jgi:hypothetical protein
VFGHPWRHVNHWAGNLAVGRFALCVWFAQCELGSTRRSDDEHFADAVGLRHQPADDLVGAGSAQLRHPRTAVVPVWSVRDRLGDRLDSSDRRANGLDDTALRLGLGLGLGEHLSSGRTVQLVTHSDISITALPGSSICPIRRYTAAQQLRSR